MSKTVLITGGSRGIGAATARLAAARGFSVCISYHSQREAAATVVQDLEESEASYSTGAFLDVSGGM